MLRLTEQIPLHQLLNKIRSQINQNYVHKLCKTIFTSFYCTKKQIFQIFLHEMQMSNAHEQSKRNNSFLFLNFVCVNNTLATFNDDVKKLFHIFKRNQYPESLINRVVKSYSDIGVDPSKLY